MLVTVGRVCEAVSVIKLHRTKYTPISTRRIRRRRRSERMHGRLSVAS